MPVALPFTEPARFTVVVPSTRSNAVAPSSVYKFPTIKDTVDEPFIVIVGTVVSFITTKDEDVEKLPEESVAVHTTVVVPRENDAGEYVITGLGSILSIAVAGTKIGVVVAPVASNV